MREAFSDKSDAVRLVFGAGTSCNPTEVVTWSLEPHSAAGKQDMRHHRFMCVYVTGYSVLYNPWLCLVFEAMEGVTSALTFTAAVTYAAKLSTTNTDTSVQGLLGGIYFGAGKPEWFWLFVKINTECYTVIKHKGERSLFNVITNMKEESEFWYEKHYVTPKDTDSRED